MVVYKIRHIPTGLYYSPVKGRWKNEKSNLSKRGKLYETKQYPKDLHTGGVQISIKLAEKFNLDISKYSYGNYLPSSKSDWEVVTFELKEIK